MLPELVKDEPHLQALNKAYSSDNSLMTLEETGQLLEKHNLMIGHEIKEDGEFLR